MQHPRRTAVVLLLAACVQSPEASIGFVLFIFLASTIWCFFSLRVAFDAEEAQSQVAADIVRDAVARIPHAEPDVIPGSGVGVATVFLRGLGLVQALAWLSLGRQVDTLLGPEGLLPFDPLSRVLVERDIAWTEFPSVLRWMPGTIGWLWAVGLLLSLVAASGRLMRPMLLASGALYGAYMLAGRDFFSFQWDLLLTELSFVAVGLSPRRRARWAHVLLRLVLFKLYFESGLCKWQSGAGDWKAGSAMALYYETAPLPSPLASVFPAA